MSISDSTQKPYEIQPGGESVKKTAKGSHPSSKVKDLARKQLDKTQTGSSTKLEGDKKKKPPVSSSPPSFSQKVVRGVLTGLLASQLPGMTNAWGPGLSLAQQPSGLLMKDSFTVSNILPLSIEDIERTQLVTAPYFSPNLTHVAEIAEYEPILFREASVDEYIRLGRPQYYQNPRICVFTSYSAHTQERMQASRMVANNQQAFSEKNGYTYRVYEENLALETDPEAGDVAFEPYWSKIAGINMILNNQEPSIKDTPEWIIWMDDDAIISNPDFRFEDVLHHYTSQQEDLNFIVTTDSLSHVIESVPLNSAVLFIRNNDWSRDFFRQVWEMRNTKVEGKPYTYGTCPNQECLHEQQAITNLLFNDPELAEHARIIPQRDYYDPVDGWGINTFRRESHYDVARNQHLVYSRDQYQAKAGDFIQQCTGLATQGYTTENTNIRNLRFDCIKQVIGETREMFPAFFSLVDYVEERMEEDRSETIVMDSVRQTLNDLHLPPTEGYDLFKSAIDHITSETVGSLISSRDINVADGKVMVTYKIPLMKGYSTLSLTYDQNADEVTLEGTRRGMSKEAWKIFNQYASESREGHFPVDSSGQLTTFRPTFKWEIHNEQELSTALKSCEIVSKFSNADIYKTLEKRIKNSDFEDIEAIKFVMSIDFEKSLNIIEMLVERIDSSNDADQIAKLLEPYYESTSMRLGHVYNVFIGKVAELFEKDESYGPVYKNLIMAGVDSPNDSIRDDAYDHIIDLLEWDELSKIESGIQLAIDAAAKSFMKENADETVNGFRLFYNLISKGYGYEEASKALRDTMMNIDYAFSANWHFLNNNLPSEYQYGYLQWIKDKIGW